MKKKTVAKRGNIVSRLNETISISGHDYKVLRVANLGDGEDHYNGQYLHDSRQILLDAGLNKAQERRTVLHEVIHGVLALAGYSPNNEEGLVSALTAGIDSARVNGKKILK